MREDDPAVVERCLVSARPFIRAWRIADSGCSDDVKATIRRVLAGIPGEVIPIEWTGFADARNVALDAARESGCDFGLFLDADDYVAPRILRMKGSCVALSSLPKLSGDYFALECELGRLRFYRHLLARLATTTRWRGSVHEELPPEGLIPPLVPEFKVMCTREGAASRDGHEAKMRRYRDLLLADSVADPTGVLVSFRLADAHVTCGDYAAALAEFGRMLTLKADEHMRYAAIVRGADLLAAMGHPTDVVTAAFEVAIRGRPDRAEAPRWLARHLRGRGEQLERARELDEYADSLPVPAMVRWIDLSSYKEGR
jgi:glycosyltransferase involved in cell wall biosynthesis